MAPQSANRKRELEIEKLTKSCINYSILKKIGTILHTVFKIIPVS